MQLNSLIFFPQDPQTILANSIIKRRILQLLEYFINSAINIIQTFYIENHIFELDPHIGETLCQIRAYYILLLARKKHKNTSVYLQELNKFKCLHKIVQDKIENFDTLINVHGKYYKIDLQTYFEKNDLLFTLSYDLAFLIQARLLSEHAVKDQDNITTAINYKKLGNGLNITKASAKKLTQLFQKNISKLSCNFVMQMLDDLPQYSHLKKAMPYYQLIDNYNRSVLPCYETMIVLLEHILLNKFPILLISRRHAKLTNDTVRALFFPNSTGTEFEVCLNPSHDQLEQLCIVVQGISTNLDIDHPEPKTIFIEHLINIGLKNIILINMAKHPQFSAKEFSKIKDDPYPFFLSRHNIDPSSSLANIFQTAQEKLLNMQKTAEEIGCCVNNTYLFFIKHIFCSHIKKHVPHTLQDQSDQLINF